jgi:hypothetical protein
MAQGPAGTKDSERPRVTTRQDGDRLVVQLAGAWTTRSIAGEDAALAALQTNGAGRAEIDLGGVAELDTRREDAAGSDQHRGEPRHALSRRAARGESARRDR